MIIYQTLFATTSLIFLFAYYYTIGSFLYPVFFSDKQNYNTRLNENICLGFIANILFIYLWNLFLPINRYGFGLFVLICFLIGIKSGSIKNIKKIILGGFNLKFILFFLIISIWIGFLTNNPIGPYDFGLYHLQVIKWAETFPIIKGIGNLHHRLGFSCSSWLLTSQFNVFFNTKLFLWTHSGIYLLIGFINFLYIPIFSKIKRSEQIIRILYLPILVHLCFSSFPGTSSDVPVFLFTSIISLYYFKFIAYKEHDSLNMIFIISALGASSKLTFGAVIIGLLIPLIFIIIRMSSKQKYLSQGIILLSLATFTLWSYRNIVMTGYPFYPYSDISFPVEWKMDRVTVENVKNQITLYSKEYTDLKELNYNDLLNWYINKITVQHRKIEIYYPVIIGILGVLYSLVLIRKKICQMSILALPSLVPMFLWIQIPGSRFFSASFWWFGIMFIVFPFTRILKKNHYNYFLLLLIIFSISVHIFDSLGSPKNFFPKNIRSTIPNVMVQKNKNNQGLIYFSPKDDLCWDSPLPCSPEPEFWLKNIVQIREDDLGKGFKIIKTGN